MINLNYNLNKLVDRHGYKAVINELATLICDERNAQALTDRQHAICQDTALQLRDAAQYADLIPKALS